jgi:hypothetical protein
LHMSPTQAALPPAFVSQLFGPTRQSCAPARYFAHHAAQLILPAGQAAIAPLAVPHVIADNIAKATHIFFCMTSPQAGTHRYAAS